MSLRKNLETLIEKVNKWAGRPTKGGAKELRDFANGINMIHGLDAVFYDRKNGCEVKASQLCTTRVVRVYVVCDDQEIVPSDRRYVTTFTGEDGKRELVELLTYEEFVKYAGDNFDTVEEMHDVWNSFKVEKIVKYGYPHDVQTGEYAYKSATCPSYCNWDLYCRLHDLVFLRFDK